jgi:hypothetical protein
MEVGIMKRFFELVTTRLNKERDLYARREASLKLHSDTQHA